MKQSIELFEVSSGASANTMAAFVPSAMQVWKENSEPMRLPVPGTDRQLVPWGADNQMPYDIMELIDSDETMSQCMRYRTETMYAQGLRYHIEETGGKELVQAVEHLLDSTPMQEYFLGVCSDMAHFEFAVTIIHISNDRKHIAAIDRRDAMNCRFEAPINNRLPRRVFYADWRGKTPQKSEMETITILKSYGMLDDLKQLLENTKQTKFAIVTRYPSSNPSIYPIPAYAALFKSKWYDIKQLIALSKYNKLKNSAPLKYLVEVENDYWNRFLQARGITDKEKGREAINDYKGKIIEFLSGAENSGKSLFSGFYVDPAGHEVHDVKITNLDTAKQGGDWESDIQESANIICFALGVHPNVVGAVPGKAQTNNSGSDKRELFMMTQARMTPYRDLLFAPHRLVCRFNGWEDVRPEVRLIQLTTLDEHKDIKEVTTSMEE